LAVIFQSNFGMLFDKTKEKQRVQANFTKKYYSK